MNTINSAWVPTGLRWRRAVLSVMPGTAHMGDWLARLEGAKACYEREQNKHATVQERIDNALKLHKEYGVRITHEWSKVHPV